MAAMDPTENAAQFTLESTLPNLLSFARTYEHGSFTLAAKSLRVTPAAVSRSVARLEKALGATLFRRTTRELRPTAKGRAYYEKCSAALRLLASGEQELFDAEDGPEPSGLVRISVPTTYGLRRLLPSMSGFRERHPSIELEFQVANNNINFVREGFDLAVRMGAINDAGMVARKLGDFPLGVFASPKYLSRRGEPKSVDDLTKHDCIAFLMPSTGRALPWILAAPNREITPKADIRCADDPHGGIALCRAGLGLFQTYQFLVEDELSSGQLVEVLRPRAGRTRRFSLLYPKEGTRSKAVRAVTDFILAQIER
jgi:DNA-binding transcriptional LysR family regulator